MRYEYETSPRKLEYNSKTKNKKKRSKKQVSSTKRTNKIAQEKKAQRKEKVKVHVMLVANVLLILAIMFVIIYRNALINQYFSQIQKLKAQIGDIEKENAQIEISIQNSLNLSSIEQTAKDMLGMQKLTSKQTIYLSLPKKDYVEPSTEEVVIEENEGFVQKIIDFIMDIF